MAFQVELVSPEAITYSGEAEKGIARTVEGGDIAFQPGHVPFIGVLAVSWLFGAAYALIVNYNKGKSTEDQSKE